MWLTLVSMDFQKLRNHITEPAQCEPAEQKMEVHRGEAENVAMVL